MNNTNRFLHLACKINVLYEQLRSELVDRGFYTKLRKTYFDQRYFFPDKNSSVFWDDKFNKEYVAHPMAERREEIVAANINGNLNLLNIGVGRGNLEKRLWKKFGERLQYFGTDITPITIKNLKNNFKKWKFLLALPTKLPFNSSSMDQVLLLEVLEHIKPNLTFSLLKEINRVCKKNGQFIVSIPMNEGLVEMLPDNPNSHMRIYTEQLLSFELISSGFLIEKIYRLSAFQSNFFVKSLINDIFHFRKPNNLILICRKQ